MHRLFLEQYLYLLNIQIYNATTLDKIIEHNINQLITDTN